MRRAVQEQPGPNNLVTCDWCGAEEQVSGRPCRACAHYIVVLPEWAEAPRRRRKWFTRRGLAVYGVLLVLLGYIAWANYPFLPDPVILLFHKPSTSVTSASPAGQWSMVGRDVQLTRYAEGAAKDPVGRVLWSQDVGQATGSAPIVVDGIIYMGGHFKILAMESRSGRVVWQRQTTGPIDGSLALAGNLLYVGLRDHRMQALDRASGEKRWEYKTEDVITGSPTVNNGMVYFGSWDGSIYALDAATRERIWKHRTGEKVSSSTAIYDGALFANANDGNLYVLDARTGQRRLRFRTPGLLVGSPVVANDLVYFSSEGTLFAVDAGAREIPGQYHFKLVWAQFWVWSIPGIPRPPSQKGGKWRFPPAQSAGIVGAPAVTREAFYVGDTVGNFYAGDALQGTELWRFKAAAGILGSPVILGDHVYFGDQDGVFYSLDRNTGNILWQLFLGAPIEVAPVFAEGRFYVRTSDGKLHAIE